MLTYLRYSRYIRSWATDTDWPGASTMKSEESFIFAALSKYSTPTPVKVGLEPSLAVMTNALVERVCRALRGSLRSLRVSSPVLVSVATTLKFSTPSTASAPVTLSERPGAAATMEAVAARVRRAARRVVENMASFVGCRGSGVVEDRTGAAGRRWSRLLSGRPRLRGSLYHTLNDIAGGVESNERSRAHVVASE